MVFGWLRRRRRQRLRAAPFRPEWEEILQQHARFYNRLDAGDQTRIQAAIQVFVAEKNWEGCGGQPMRDLHRVTIAAHMARMTLGFTAEYFDEVKSILLYPDAYVAKGQEVIGGTLVEGDSPRLGEAWYRGPVILSWSDVLASSRGELPGRNVVIHEFAHQLDMRNGRQADGVPAIESPELATRWLQMLRRDFAQLQADCAAGHPPVLDCYGTTNPAEFLAVATEAFFECPQPLREHWPELFGLLREFFGQSPA